VTPAARPLTATQYAAIEASARLGNQRAAAHELGIGYQTLKNRLVVIYRNLDVTGMAQAAYVLWHGRGSDSNERPAATRHAAPDLLARSPDRPRRVA
jgi:hypothetical protein